MNNTVKVNYLKSRHIGPSTVEKVEMLKEIGVGSIDELISQTIPADIRLKSPLSLSSPLSEQEYLDKISVLASKNCSLRSLIGRGWYGAIMPAVIQRNILENPVWYTSYTPYQAEVSQGRLEALFIYQTVISELTGLPLANCSLLDEATAVAEAVTMMRNLRSREQVAKGAVKVFVDKKTFPSTLSVLRTRTMGQGIELVIGDYATFEPDESYFGAVIQLPNADGSVEDYSEFVKKCHARSVFVTAVEDILAMALLRPLDVDIACGSAQRLGLSMGYGGPAIGYMATRMEYKREIPGRIIGLSKDNKGHAAYRLALQTREQHIKRERATSNICTAEAMCAIMAGMYAVYHGAEGIRQIAEGIHSKTVYLNELLQAYGYGVANTEFFDTIKITHLPKGTISDLRNIAEANGINFYYDSEGWVSLSIDETVNLKVMNQLICIFAEASGNRAKEETGENAFSNLWNLPQEWVRPIDYLQHDVFRLYRTETEMMRYLKRLERKDISLTHSMISLGSCTMKLNPASTMLPISMPAWNICHPLTPHDQVKGYIELLEDLKSKLCTITGFDSCSLQPTSGAAGEYAGLVTIRDYLLKQEGKKSGVPNRHILLIPESAHGTNPASCTQAGFTPVIVKCDANGNTDLTDWKDRAETNKEHLAGCMITYPSTHGIFESTIRQMCAIIHECGGQVYMDGANMNAQIAHTSPQNIGADICHLNLHKSFACPHGGGGPGAGAICCASHLTASLPSEDNNRVSSSLYGNASTSIIAYGYISMMGEEGLKEATTTAILNANYMAQKLKDAYGIVYTGNNGRVGHELILDCRQFHPFGITEGDIAKRLMDYGYHAPTLSFPVHGTLMIEPTESESKREIDRFIEVLLQIRKEIQEVIDGEYPKEDNVLINAPHAEYEVVVDQWSHAYNREKAVYPLPYLRENKFWIPVGRVDNGYGDRNLIARIEDTSSALEK